MRDRRGPATVTEEARRTHAAAATGREAGKARREGSEARRPPSDPSTKPSRKGVQGCEQSQSDACRRALSRPFCRLARCRPRPRPRPARPKSTPRSTKAVEYVRAAAGPGDRRLRQLRRRLATTALAAAGVDAGDLQARTGDPSLQDFLLGEYGSAELGRRAAERAATDYEQATLVAHAAGLDPARLSAVSNLPAQLAGLLEPRRRQLRRPEHQQHRLRDPGAGDDAAAALGAGAGGLLPAPQPARRRRLDLHRRADPGAPAKPSEEDMTGAAIAALCEAGRAGL